MNPVLKSKVVFKKQLPFVGLESSQPKPKARRVSMRMYDAARFDRLTSDWNTSTRKASSVIRTALPRLRDRSRDLAENSDYFKRFLKALNAGVIGALGVKFQNKAKTPDGSALDKVVNDDIENQFKIWSKAINASVTRMKSFREIQRLAMECVARDGEVFIRKVIGYPNPFGFALQIIEADEIDDTFDDTSTEGNIIRMGVELDKWGAPVAYYRRTIRPGDDRHGIIGQNRERIEAKEIIHLFMEDRPNQVRGVPWAHTAMRRLHMLKAYEEAELTAARLAAAKMAFITSPVGDETDEPEPGEDGQDEGTGEAVMEFEPGMIERLEEGTEYTLSDPTHPAGNFAPFIKALLKGIAAGLNISYVSLSNDLEGVNFSSIRSGLLSERDGYIQTQEWFKDHFLDLFWPEWFIQAELRNRFSTFRPAEIDRVARPEWQGRRWPWVDPEKDAKANKINVDNAFVSRSQIIREQGKDPQEVAEEMRQDLETFDGLTVEDQTDGGEENGEETNDDGTTQGSEGGRSIQAV